MRRSTLPQRLRLLKPSNRVELLHRKLDGKSGSVAAPAIAFEATDQSLAMTVDFDKPFPATLTVH